VRRTNVARRTRVAECAKRRVGSWQGSSTVDRGWPASERVAMRGGLGGDDEGGALLGGEASDAAQGGLVAVWASQPLGARLGVLVGGCRSRRGEQELKTAQGSAFGFSQVRPSGARPPAGTSRWT
jgi:hypothetical protein